MFTVKKIFASALFTSTIFAVIFVTIFSVTVCVRAGSVSAATAPNLVLTSNGSSINISVTGAGQYATVMFYYPTNSAQTSYTPIDIGQTNSSGSFSVNVTPSSYGLAPGILVYVSVGNAESAHVAWPATSNSGQLGTGLSLSRQSVDLLVGQTANIVPMSAAGTLSVGGNTNPAVATISVQESTFFVNALAAGSSTATLCVLSNGCGTLQISVQAPSQKITFSQTQVNLAAGQNQTISIYGPGMDYYGLTSSNKDAVTAKIDGSNLVISGLTVGQSVLSLCATGWQCGSITVNSLTPGSDIPVSVVTQAPSYSDQPPQLSSISVSSNNVYGTFFGVGSTLTINFTANQGITNIQTKVAGVQTAVSQNNSGLCSATYTLSGRETLPIPIVINFVNASGQKGQTYLWIGNSATLPTGVSAVSTVGAGTSGQASNSSHVFKKYLYAGMTALGVSDPDVKALQERLKADGLFSGAVTGYFGSVTKASVQAYQKKNNLSPVGVVGVSTRALLNRGI